jgi:hypothetical protein
MSLRIRIQRVSLAFLAASAISACSPVSAQPKAVLTGHASAPDVPIPDFSGKNPLWIEATNVRCWAYNPQPGTPIKITWDGACSRHLLSGPGTLQWYDSTNKSHEMDKGTFSGGMMQGVGTLTFYNTPLWNGTIAVAATLTNDRLNSSNAVTFLDESGNVTRSLVEDLSLHTIGDYNLPEDAAQILEENTDAAAMERGTMVPPAAQAPEVASSNSQARNSPAPAEQPSEATTTSPSQTSGATQESPSSSGGSRIPTLPVQQHSDAADSRGILLLHWTPDNQTDPLSDAVTQRVKASVDVRSGETINAFATCQHTFADYFNNQAWGDDVFQNIELDVYTHNNVALPLQWSQSNTTTVEGKVDDQDPDSQTVQEQQYDNVVNVQFGYGHMSSAHSIDVELNTSDGNQPVFDINPQDPTLRALTDTCWSQYQADFPPGIKAPVDPNSPRL